MVALTVTATVTDAGGHTGTATATATIVDPALFAESFDGVPAGAQVDQTNTGYTSVAGSIVGGAAGGDKHAQLSNTASTSSRLDTPTWPATAKLLASFELTLDQLPAATVRAGGGRAAGVTVGAFGIGVGGKLTVYDGASAAGTSIGAVAAGVRYRYEHFLDSTPGQDTQTARAVRVSDGTVVATVTGAYSGPALDGYRNGFFTAGVVAGKLHSAKAADGAGWVPSSPPPPASAVVVGASSNRPGAGGRLPSMQQLDADLAAVTGHPAPVLRFWHVYNDSIPASWAASNGAASAANGWDSLTNIKWPDGYVRTTAGRDALTAFLTSMPPPPFKVWLVGRHEPENDKNETGGLSAAEKDSWRRDFAEFARIVLDFDPNGAHVIPVSVMMGDPPDHSPWEDFDYRPHLRRGDQDRIVWAWDAYPRCRTGPDRTDDPGFKYDPPAAWARARGFTRLGIGESTLNNDAGVPQALVDHWWQVKLPAWLAANPDVEFYAAYDASGPAAGTNGYISTPGELLGLGTLALASS